MQSTKLIEALLGRDRTLTSVLAQYHTYLQLECPGVHPDEGFTVREAIEVASARTM